MLGRGMTRRFSGNGPQLPSHLVLYGRMTRHVIWRGGPDTAPKRRWTRGALNSIEATFPCYPFPKYLKTIALAASARIHAPT